MSDETVGNDASEEDAPLDLPAGLADLFNGLGGPSLGVPTTVTITEAWDKALGGTIENTKTLLESLEEVREAEDIDAIGVALTEDQEGAQLILEGVTDLLVLARIKGGYLTLAEDVPESTEA